MQGAADTEHAASSSSSFPSVPVSSPSPVYLLELCSPSLLHDCGGWLSAAGRAVQRAKAERVSCCHPRLISCLDDCIGVVKRWRRQRPFFSHQLSARTFTALSRFLHPIRQHLLDVADSLDAHSSTASYGSNQPKCIADAHVPAGQQQRQQAPDVQLGEAGETERVVLPCMDWGEDQDEANLHTTASVRVTTTKLDEEWPCAPRTPQRQQRAPSPCSSSRDYHCEHERDGESECSLLTPSSFSLLSSPLCLSLSSSSTSYSSFDSIRLSPPCSPASPTSTRTFSASLQPACRVKPSSTRRFAYNFDLPTTAVDDEDDEVMPMKRRRVGR